MESYIEMLYEVGSRLGFPYKIDFYRENEDYLVKNQGQFKSIIEKKLPDDKLRVIFQSHFNKLMNNMNNIDTKVEFQPVKVVSTAKFAVYEWA